MTSPFIEKAKAGDVEAIVHVMEKAYRGEASQKGWTSEAHLIDGARTSTAEIQAEMDDPQTLMLVARAADGHLLGCAGITHDGPSCKFGKFAVDPGQQAKGVGKLLLEAAEAAAVSQFGVSLMTMTVIDGRTELEAFYERRGYARTGKYVRMHEINRRDDITFGHDLILFEYAKALI
jgi:GNAT superfamily N-acetyltransferase